MNKITATILALLILLPMASAAINVGTGAIPSEPERASSVKVLSFGDNAIICVNCPELITAPEPGLASSTLASYMPRIECKGDTPCVIYTGLKVKGIFNPVDAAMIIDYTVASKDGYQKAKPVIGTNGLNSALENVQADEVIVDSTTLYTVENPHKIILQNAKAYFNNLPAGTETPLEGTLSAAEQERAEQIKVTEEEKGQILKIRGLDKRAPNQLVDEFSIPLKKGDTITFKGLLGDKEYSLEEPVLNIGKFTDNEDASTAEDANAEDWLDELDNKFLDADKDRSELKICSKKFANYYAGSSFQLTANEGKCGISEYLLNTELFESNDADENNKFAYSCGDIVFEAVGGNAKNLYCNQADIHNAVLSCGKNGLNEVCTGVQGKTKMKIRIEPGSFDIDNKEGYMFKSIKETTTGQQKAYEFLTGKLKIRTHPQSENPLRFDLILGVGEKPFVITYKDDKALGTSTITMPENTIVSRRRGAQIFSYNLKQADYKGVLGEGLHQINLIFPSGLVNNDENSIKISEAKTRGATRDDIALLGAVAEEAIEISSPETHLYTVTPIQPGQETSAAEAVTSTTSVVTGEATTLGEYAYRYCWGTNPPSPFTGRPRDVARQIAIRLMQNNQGVLELNQEDFMETIVPAGTVLEAPNTITSYRAGNSVVNIRLAPQGCVVPLTAPAIEGEQCMNKPGAIVKCVPKSRQSQCSQVYQPGEGVTECMENNVCCEVMLTHSAGYCVLPEENAFLPNGAKCKVSIGCSTSVSNADYGQINNERVNPCAEGLSCCKQARSSSRANGNDDKCTNSVSNGVSGQCADIRSNDCTNAATGEIIPFVAGKCLSNRASWYQCCVGGVSPKETSHPAAEETTTACTDANGECRVRCGVGEKAGSEAQSNECKGTSAFVGATVMLTDTCCVPEQAASATCASLDGTCAVTCEQGEQKSGNEDANKDCRDISSNQRMSCCVPAQASTPCDGREGQCKTGCSSTEREASAFNVYCSGKKCCAPKS
ncbi:MAG: hypothetical protein WC852_07205 [Candidatus Nanoarchaeia archaeon]|jgi:hypothetical protein